MSERCFSSLREAECATYLDIKVAVEALDEHNEGARQVVPQGRRVDGLAGVLGPRANQEALRRCDVTERKRQTPTRTLRRSGKDIMEIAAFTGNTFNEMNAVEGYSR